jgi:hypothetical protein
MTATLQGYRHDVFISYSRAAEWPRWVEDQFLPVFHHWLTAELGRDADIFLDTRSVLVGQRWPDELERGLAASRTIVPLWTVNYFSSDWCCREISSMLERSDRLRQRQLSDRVVFPLAIHDSAPEKVPPAVSHLQIVDIRACADPYVHPDSPRREELSGRLRAVCEQVAEHILAVPSDSYRWPLPDYTHYYQQIRRDPPGQHFMPSLGQP